MAKSYSKEMLLDRIVHIVHAYRYIVLALELSRTKPLDVLSFELNEGSQVIRGSEYQHMFQLMDNKMHENLKGSFWEFVRAAPDYFILKEVFEEIKHYCKVTNQIKLFYGDIAHKYVDAMRFAQVVRNVASHIDLTTSIRWGYEFDEVRWNDLTISKNHSYKDIRLTTDHIYALLKDMCQFTKDVLI